MVLFSLKNDKFMHRLSQGLNDYNKICIIVDYRLKIHQKRTMETISNDGEFLKTKLH